MQPRLIEVFVKLFPGAKLINFFPDNYEDVVCSWDIWMFLADNCVFLRFMIQFLCIFYRLCLKMWFLSFVSPLHMMRKYFVNHNHLLIEQEFDTSKDEKCVTKLTMHELLISLFCNLYIFLTKSNKLQKNWGKPLMMKWQKWIGRFLEQWHIYYEPVALWAKFNEYQVP